MFIHPNETVNNSPGIWMRTTKKREIAKRTHRKNGQVEKKMAAVRNVHN